MTDVTEKYFALLKEYFQPLQKYALKRNLLGPRVAECLCDIYSSDVIKGMLLTLTKDMKDLNWNLQKKGLESMHGIKTAYLGNAYLYQNYQETTIDFLKKTALYSDTLIINDPILSELLTWEKRGTGDISAFNLTAQYALRLLTLEKLFNSDLNPPICYLAPCSILCLGQDVCGPTDEFIQEFIVPTYAGKIFHKDFSSSEEVVDFLKKFRDFNEFILAVQKSKVPFINPDGSPVTEQDFLQVKVYYDDKYEDHFEFPEALFLLLRGRYGMPAYDLSVNGSYVTSFATDFKGVWKNFVWLLNNDNYQIAKLSKKKPLSKDTLVLQTLQNETLRWIGNVPIEKVIEMRQRGELQEMRELLTQCICEIENVNDEEFFEVATEAEYRLQQAFRKHSNEVTELSNTFKRRYKIDLVSIFVTGSLGVVSAMYPPLAQSIGFLSSSIVEGVSISKLITNFLEERDSAKALKRRPVGMLFEAWKMMKN